MTKKKDLPNNLKFGIYFIICAIILFAILYIIIPPYYPTILLLSIVIYPGILSVIEGILATIFYLENKAKKVTRFSFLFIIILLIANTVYWSETYMKGILAPGDNLFFIVFFSVTGSMVYLIGTQSTSHFVSALKQKKIPNIPEIENNILCYQYTGSRTPVIDTLRKINGRFFDYKIPKKPHDEDDSYEFTKIPANDKYLLMVFDRKVCRDKDGISFKRFFVF